MSCLHSLPCVCGSDPCKYFGCELGAQTQFDTKNDRYIVNGSHDAAKLQDLLDGFIKRFVLCPECENPETVLFPNVSVEFECVCVCVLGGGKKWTNVHCFIYLFILFYFFFSFETQRQTKIHLSLFLFIYLFSLHY